MKMVGWPYGYIALKLTNLEWLKKDVVLLIINDVNLSDSSNVWVTKKPLSSENGARSSRLGVL